MQAAFWFGLLAFVVGIFIGFRLRHLTSQYDIQFVVERKHAAPASGAESGSVRTLPRSASTQILTGQQEEQEEGEEIETAAR
jgi:hypothetical protein